MEFFKRKPLALFIAGTLLSSMPLLLQAEVINYDKDENLLDEDPVWRKPGSLFPKSLSGNEINIIDGDIPGRVFGGVTYDSADVFNNKVIVYKGKIGHDLVGGFSYKGHATNNSVTINGGALEYIYGGQSFFGDSIDNSVIINGGTIAEDIYGGSSQDGDVSNNNVTVVDGDVGSVYGGNSARGDSRNNNLVIDGGVINAYATGGYGSSATDNSVTINGGAVESVAGGKGSNTTNNSVIINAGAINTATGGGGSNSSGNSIVVNGGSVGSASGGDGGNSATNNSVTIVEGSVGYAYGGYNADNISGNTVIVSGGSLGGVAGGMNFSGSVIDNTVTLLGNPKFRASSSLYGGYATTGSGNIFSGNTLNFSAQPISVRTVANFEHYNFTLNPEYANTTTALITATNITLGADVSAPSKVQVVGIQSGKALNANDKFVLMQATDSMKGYGQGMTSIGIGQQGISLLYNIKTNVDTEGKVITATILGDEPEPPFQPNAPAGRMNPQLKSLSEGYIAGAMIINKGADAVANDAFNAIDAQNNQSGIAPFITASASRTRYNSGSHVKSNDVVLTSGLSYQNENVTSAVFLEAGRGSYDSYNSFSNAAKVHGSGNTRYYGAGVLGRYAFDNNIYTDASVRAGNSRTKFDTSDLQNLATGESAKYNQRSNYISAHIGTGYILPLNERNTLDISAKYLHSSVEGSKVNVAGDSIEFKRINSERVRANAVLNHTYSETLSVNAGVGYEHEFDSKAKATALSTYKIDAPSVKGGTGVFSVGINVKPSAYKNVSFDFNTDAYTGKREGIGASIRAGYAF